MKKLVSLLCICVSVLLASCSTSKSVVSRDIDLSKYKYVAVIDDDTHRIPPRLMEYQIQLYDAVELSGLTMVGQYRIGELTRSEKSCLLLATFGISSREEDTTITVNFLDFDTGRPVVSCQGAYSTLGISRDADLSGALKGVSEQIAKTFK